MEAGDMRLLEGPVLPGLPETCYSLRKRDTRDRVWWLSPKPWLTVLPTSRPEPQSVFLAGHHSGCSDPA